MHAKVGRFVVELIYDANKGVVSPRSKDLAVGEEYGVLPTPERNGYTFNGWYTEEDGGTPVGPSTVISSSNTTIYAHWNANSYELTVDPADGEWQTHTSTQTYQLEYDKASDEMIIPDPTRVGYTFTGWTLTGTGSTYDVNTKKFVIGYEDASLTATWQINSYTLTIDYDNGDEDDEFTLNYGSTKTIEEPEKEGYTFTGWEVSTDDDIATLIDGDDVYTQPAHDIKLTATWQVNNYKWIVYHKKMDLNGNPTIISDTEEGEDEFGETFSGTLKNYKGFINPALQEKTIKVENNYPPTTNVINYEYERNQYRLTIDANGGTYSGTNPINNIYYQDTRTISNPTKSCNTFNNWTLNGTGSTIQNGIFTMGTENATLTANWTRIQYTITFNPNGGTINVPANATQTVLCGNAVNLLAASDLTREDYTFDGWYTQATGGTKVEAGTVPSQSQVLFAHWTWDYEGITADEIEYSYSKSSSTNVRDALNELRSILS